MRAMRSKRVRWWAHLALFFLPPLLLGIPVGWDEVVLHLSVWRPV